MAALMAAARELWEHLAGSGVGFAPAISVAVAPRSSVCPSGWVGIVVIGDAVLATAPDHRTALLVEQALSGLPATSLTVAEVLRRRLRIAEIRGPAALAYLDPAEFRRQPGASITGPLDLDHRGLQRFLMAAAAGDVEESGLQGITSRPSLSVSTARSLPPRLPGLALRHGASERADGRCGARPRLRACCRVSGRRPCDRGGEAAAMAGTA